MARTVNKSKKKESEIIPQTARKKSLSVKPPVIHTKKPKKVTPRKSKAIREIRYFQTHIGNLVPKIGFVRFVKGKMNQITEGNPLRFEREALNLFQEVYEAYMTSVFESSYLCSLHGKRVTLYPADIDLVKKIKD